MSSSTEKEKGRSRTQNQKAYTLNYTRPRAHAPPPASMENCQILLVVFPAQGHLNPALQFTTRLLKTGVQVTFTTSIAAHRRIPVAAAMTAGLTFTTFSDGFDDGFNIDTDDGGRLMSELKHRGSETVREIVAKSTEQGRPITAVVYTLLLPWAAEVAREVHLPSALLWPQPATVIDIYHHYFNGYDDIINAEWKDPFFRIELPGLPIFQTSDLPSYFSPTDPNRYALPLLKQQLDTLDEEENPIVLVNTFDALEPEALQVIPKYKMFAVGPLMPSTSSVSQDSPKNTSNYMEFLNSNKESSVVYISFGSVLISNKAEVEEIARAMLDTKRPFLWVIRDADNYKAQLDKYIVDMDKQGMIVPWCSQLDVLTHPSVGCFVTHCGWNSTLESLTCGVPVVAFPHWMDQSTNAKLLEDVWCTGVRVRASENDGMVHSSEISKCVEIVINGCEKFRRNAIKWKNLAKEALKDGGFVDQNLKRFLDTVCLN